MDRFDKIIDQWRVEVERIGCPSSSPATLEALTGRLFLDRGRALRALDLRLWPK
jgi:hypothetical protein